VALNYVPTQVPTAPAEHGFDVSRTYEAVANAHDVRRATDGAWVVKAGSVVRVRTNIQVKGTRHFVAVVDRLPAGFEPLDPELKSTDTLSPVQSSERRSYWFNHQNMRDDRMEVFGNMLPAGNYEFVYFARATTPGKFIAPPMSAEEMYSPEVTGRTAGEVVCIRE
jgi:alpha-2-macroglobulin